MRILKWVVAVVFILISVGTVTYVLGPTPKAENIPDNLPIYHTPYASAAALEAQVAAYDARDTDVKTGNQSRVIWANDSLKQKTPYAFVYLHGFSASPMEGWPIHEQLAKRYGANLYLPRLSQHGRKDVDAFADLTVESYIQSAKEALAIGRELGEKVILISCSTGGSLGLYLSAADTAIAGHLAFSPNIQVADPNAKLLTGPWGMELARMVFGGDYRSWVPENDSIDKYWTSKYRIEGLIQLQLLIENCMKPELFEQVKQPFFLGYYYKNEEEQDPTVSVAKMLEMYEQLGSKTKRKQAFPEAGAHVICSPWTSKAWEEVQAAAIAFLEEEMQLKAVSE
ncbi:alpha/beta hydrolase [Saprospira grandis]|uniref:AB hydrolase-1 domain-containing protein n=1 Tax=Saprospira grandis (strain Lewin) TaxID=984262 RepID=H6LAA4_SAPGL|nr:alpha/beta fold hydrolase [Saprospira grandis]AFC24389.1 hypothetical protein SGRA_1654 [Saprospira grandis str. Lewin]